MNPPIWTTPAAEKTFDFLKLTGPSRALAISRHLRTINLPLPPNFIRRMMNCGLIEELPYNALCQLTYDIQEPYKKLKNYAEFRDLCENLRNEKAKFPMNRKQFDNAIVQFLTDQFKELRIGEIRKLWPDKGRSRITGHILHRLAVEGRISFRIPKQWEPHNCNPLYFVQK